MAQKISDVKLYDPIAEDSVMLSDYGHTVLVVIFWCNDCAYSQYYLERIKQLDKVNSDVRFILINPAPEKLSSQESLDDMVRSYKDQKLGMPYLADKEQIARRSFGAMKCPEAFVLEKSGTSFTILYHGAIDDSPQVESQVKEHFLKDAIGKARLGQPVVPDYKRPIGCIVKKN